MKDLFAAIKTKFENNAILSGLVQGRLFLNHAAQGIPLPYLVFLLISDVPDDTYASRLEKTRIQFSIFSKDASSEPVCDIFAALKTCYDYSQLVVAGYNFVEMRRVSSVLLFDAEAWHYLVEYQILLQEV